MYVCMYVYIYIYIYIYMSLSLYIYIYMYIYIYVYIYIYIYHRFTSNKHDEPSRYEGTDRHDCKSQVGALPAAEQVMRILIDSNDHDDKGADIDAPVSRTDEDDDDSNDNDDDH